MMWFASWGRAYSRHLESEIGWLKSELRFQRDENQRLMNALVSFKFGGTVSTVAPAMPREVAPPVVSRDEEAFTAEFNGAGAFDEEPASRGAV